MFHPFRVSVRVRFTLSVALLCIASAAAGTPGVRLSWNHCAGEGTGAHNAVFACASNLGSHTMIGSFVLDSDFPTVIGVEVFIDLATASAALPPWWDLRGGSGCRSTSLGVNFVPEASNAVCQDWSAGLAQGGLATYCTISGPCFDHPAIANGARIKLIAAVPQNDAKDLVAGTEYFAFNVVLNHARTLGVGNCAGCEIPACIGLTHINVVNRGATEQRLITTPYEPGGNALSWQGGGSLTVGPGMSCPAVTANRSSTWGAVKSLYR